MIYLIITTSINNRYGTNDANERKERYLYAISETLKIVPYKTIIVENNGKRDTYLDSLQEIFYTDNNKYSFKSKGINELFDIKDVIKQYNIQDDDIIIRLTGRYRLLSSHFLDQINTYDTYDAFIKFYGSCSLQFEQYDCILGCYAIRAKYIKLYNPLLITNYKSAEVAFARYIRFCGAKVKEIKHLDVECSFSDDLRIVIM